MDEIWDRLCPDAMIVSTKKQHGKIVMEPPPSQRPYRPNRHGLAQLDLEHYSQSNDWQKTRAATKTSAPPAKSIAHQNELAGVRRDLATLQDMLTGMVLTDLNGINPALALSTG